MLAVKSNIPPRQKCQGLSIKIAEYNFSGLRFLKQVPEVRKGRSLNQVRSANAAEFIGLARELNKSYGVP